MGRSVTGSVGMRNILKGLQEQQLVVPYLENAFHGDKWPDVYNIEVDAMPYYGLTDEEGISHDVGVGDGYFHPSSHPLMSARELYYRWHPEHSALVKNERRSLVSHMTLAVGSAMHAVVQTQLIMAKLLVTGSGHDEWSPVEHMPNAIGRFVPENPVEWEYINKEHMVRGRMDGIMDHPLGQMGFEFKTMNSRSFRFLEAPKDEWRYQLNLGLDHFNLHKGVVLVLEMGYPFTFKEFEVNRSEAILDEVYTKFDYVRECVKRDTPPRCEHSFQSAQSRNCPVGHLCWATTED